MFWCCHWLSYDFLVSRKQHSNLLTFGCTGLIPPCDFLSNIHYKVHFLCPKLKDNSTLLSGLCKKKIPFNFNSCIDKTDKSKRYLFSFGGKQLTDKKLPPLFFRSILNPTHHLLCFCLFFLSVPTDWIRKCCGRKLGGQFC